MELRCVPSIVIVTGNVGMNRNSWSSYLECTEVCAWKEMSSSVTHQKKWSITTGVRTGREGSWWLMQWDDCRAEENGSQAILDRSYAFGGKLREDTKESARNLEWPVGAREERKTKAQPSLDMLRVNGLHLMANRKSMKGLRYVSIRLKSLFKDLESNKTESYRANTKLCRACAIFRYLVSCVASPTTAILLFAVFMFSSLNCSFSWQK